MPTHFYLNLQSLKCNPWRRQKKRATIQDIANYTNVSIGTVDRVIHNRGKVSSVKKKKILEAIKILDFNPLYLAEW